MTISEQCADYIIGVHYDRLPAKVHRMARNCLIDYFACTLAGSACVEMRVMERFLADYGTEGLATVVGKDKRCNPLHAAMTNAYACHILECDDVHRTSITHPAAPVISTALAMAEHLHASGKDLITAIVVGYELMIRAGEAVMPSHYDLWHTTATCGNFGAAAAAGKLLGLSREALVNAIGNAGSQAAGLWEFLEDNAMTKYLHCGKAAYNGMLSAILSGYGLTGPRKIFEGRCGFVRATSQNENPETKFATLGDEYRILETSFKPYASCRHTHPAIDAVLALKERHGITPEAVEDIYIKTYQMALERAKNNATFADARAARFSFAYCAAAALCRGEVAVEAFTDEALQDPITLATAKKVHIDVDEQYNEAYPERWMCHVSMKLKDGDMYDQLVEFPKGDLENPFSDADFETKYVQLVTHVIGQEKALELLDKCRTIDRIEDMSCFL